MLDNQQDLSYAYIKTSDSFDSLPDEISILFVREKDEDIYLHDSPFEKIIVTGNQNIDIQGQYVSKDVIGEDSLLHYRRYIKDLDTKMPYIMWELQQQSNKIFYHNNPYFDVQSISDDEFLKRTALPF